MAMNKKEQAAFKELQDQVAAVRVGAAANVEAERLEAKARNWRIGMAVTPKLKSHPFFGRVGVIREIVDVGNSEPRGRSEKLMVDVWGQFAVHKLTEPADDWKAA